jgi:(p)ppGpp synthase/HD superfamily hydrolase
VSATLEQIEAKVRAYNPDADLTGLDEAYEFAQRAHSGQVRKSGEPFVNHPVEVALILAELHLDTATLKAALLHDTVEDSEVTLDEVRERFGDEVQNSSTASPSTAGSSSSRSRSSRATTCARCSSRWRRTSASSS